MLLLLKCPKWFLHIAIKFLDGNLLAQIANSKGWGFIHISHYHISMHGHTMLALENISNHVIM